MADVVQWLNEIQDLKRQLQKAQQAEASAHASADNWRKRYEIEAHQRRAEAESAVQPLVAAQPATSPLPPETSAKPTSDGIVDALRSDIEQKIEHLDTVAALKATLIEIWAERDRLADDFKTEQLSHAQTRKDLSMALGDAVEMLAKLNPQD
ncbi:hypothetical protein [Myxacorys almedinensis]|uniref:Uncharacterized protein n=1 Tax=Myxacorys almedinensis A TaxID=2690445 RepID=A0A8J7ZA76_9CYAN|nr:hypothetical protein [Myxacorys almedinensis]NDJ19213.1 hypothetical protein [Myxacorys almedinensis A]